MKHSETTAFLLLFITGLLFYCYEFYLRLLTGAYENQIVHYFGINTHLSFSFLISSYNIMYLLMQIPAGMILDRFGSKKVLTAATLICGLGNIIFTLPSYPLALSGRLLIGFGSSFAFVGVLKISREYLPLQYFAFFASIVIALGTLAAAFSQQLSIFLLSYHLSWIRIFIYSGIAAIPLALLFYAVLSLSSQHSYFRIMPNPKEVKHFLVKLTKNTAIWINSIWGGLLYIPTVVLTSQYGVKYFQSLYHVSTYTATQSITFLLLGWVVGSPLIGYLADVTAKIKFLIIISGILLIFSLVVLTYTPTSHFFVLIFLIGIFSSAQVLVWHVFNKICSFQFSAMGIAFTNMIITGVTEIGQLSSGLLLDWQKGLQTFSHFTGFRQPMQFEMLLFLSYILLSIVVFLNFHRKKYFL